MADISIVKNESPGPTSVKNNDDEEKEYKMSTFLPNFEYHFSVRIQQDSFIDHDHAHYRGEIVILRFKNGKFTFISTWSSILQLTLEDPICVGQQSCSVFVVTRQGNQFFRIKFTRPHQSLEFYELVKIFMKSRDSVPSSIEIHLQRSNPQRLVTLLQTVAGANFHTLPFREWDEITIDTRP